ncbi:MAG: glycosyltransferase family 61 protein [bacterium]|jgi:hypothetical protein
MFLDSNFLYKNIHKKDRNNREINLYKITDVSLIGQNLYYPNCLLKKESNVINPMDEKIMSLKDVTTQENYSINDTVKTTVLNTPVFYFVYNTDNYYHFIYDTLPYLMSYKFIKKEIPSIKLLMNYPAENNNKFYPFVLEFLNLLDIDVVGDVVICDSNTVYKEIYISNSYTHGIDSNLPPRYEVYQLYKHIVGKVTKSVVDYNNQPKKIYVSRRSWMHNDFTNIGTNYTTRRKLINEDELVESLVKQGFVEVFTENLTTVEKILLFSQVEYVVGSIGGGMCNVLFSKPQTKVLSIISPTFLDVNNRFKYSFSNVNVSYFTETSHVSNDLFKKYMRVKCNDVIGEIIDVSEDELTISYSKNFVAGWNNQTKYENKILNKKYCKPLDNGLNSEWTLNVKDLITTIYNGE